MDEVFKCNKCNFYESINQLSLKKHAKRCDGSFQGHECPLCMKKLMSKPLLQQHNTSSHSVRENRECPHCLKTLNLKEIDQYRHQKNCWNNPKNNITYNCYYCKRKYIDEASRNKHAAGCYFKPLENIDEVTFNTISENNSKNVGIYKIVSPAGSVYIGMTSDSFENRWSGHLKQLSRNKHHCIGLQRAYNKYGWEALDKIILEEYSKRNNNDETILLNNFLLLREIQVWEEYKVKKVNIYNGRPTGTGSVKHTEESKEKARLTYYLNNESFCKIYTGDCEVCGNPFALVKESKTCGVECSHLLKLRLMVEAKERLKVSKKLVKTPPYKVCKYGKCYNFVEVPDLYCSIKCRDGGSIERWGLENVSRDEVVALYWGELCSTSDLAKKFNTSHTNIIKFLKILNIPVRSRSEGLKTKWGRG